MDAWDHAILSKDISQNVGGKRNDLQHVRQYFIQYQVTAEADLLRLATDSANAPKPRKPSSRPSLNQKLVKDFMAQTPPNFHRGWLETARS